MGAIRRLRSTAATTGATTEIGVSQGGMMTRPPHVSKGAGYELTPGDWVEVQDAGRRRLGRSAPARRARVGARRRRGYISAEVAATMYGYSEHAKPDAAEPLQSIRSDNGRVKAQPISQ